MEVGDPDGFGRFGMLDRDEDTVACHECGKKFRSLVQHLHHKHQMSTAGYRAQHRLPAGLPLTCLETSRMISEKSATRVGTADWRAFEEARDRTLPASQRAATQASAHRPAPATTARRAAEARARFSGIREDWQAGEWRDALADVQAFHARTGSWPKRGSRARTDADENRLGEWLSHQRQLAHRDRQPAWKLRAMTEAGIDLTPGRGARR